MLLGRRPGLPLLSSIDTGSSRWLGRRGARKCARRCWSGHYGGEVDGRRGFPRLKSRKAGTTRPGDRSIQVGLEVGAGGTAPLHSQPRRRARHRCPGGGAVAGAARRSRRVKTRPTPLGHLGSTTRYSRNPPIPALHPRQSWTEQRYSTDGYGPDQHHTSTVFRTGIQPLCHGCRGFEAVGTIVVTLSIRST